MALQHIYTGKSKFTDEEIDEIDLEAPDLIPNRVATILQQSRPDLAGVIPANQSSRPHKLTPRPRRSPVHVARAGSANYVAAAIEEDQRPRASAQGGNRSFAASALQMPKRDDIGQWHVTLHIHIPRSRSPFQFNVQPELDVEKAYLPSMSFECGQPCEISKALSNAFPQSSVQRPKTTHCVRLSASIASAASCAIILRCSPRSFLGNR